MIQPLTALPVGARRLGSTMVISSTFLARRMCKWLCSASSSPRQGLDQHATALDFRCISWMLQTSLDKAVHLSTLKHLATTATSMSSCPTLIADCFDDFIGRIRGVMNHDHEVVVVQGLEQLATVSALCFFRVISNSLVADPTSSALEDARQRCPSQPLFPC